MNKALEWRWLGRMNFAEALALQEELVARKRENRDTIDELLLLEHEPVYTIGRTPDQSSLVDAAHLPHPLFAINRDGQATYHGPGQLIGYPIIVLPRCGQYLPRYLRWLEKLLIKTLAIYEISAKTRPGLTGVWIENRKIASIGVGVRLFFFSSRRRHTSYWRDWSSDVCSSDLAHADCEEILRWLGGFATAPRKTYLVHGEPDGCAALADAIRARYGWSVTAAGDGETVML